jgi:predicted amidohydrolase
MSEPISPVRVAVVQFDPQVGINNRETNLLRSLALAQEAVDGGANLVVLPELSNVGYFFSSRRTRSNTPSRSPTGEACRPGSISPVSSKSSW